MMKKIQFLFVVSLIAVLAASCATSTLVQAPSRSQRKVSPLEGSWAGTLELYDQNLAVAIHIFEDGALFDVPDQRLWSYPLGKTVLEDNAISFELSLGPDLFQVRLEFSENTLSGNFAKEIANGLFTLKRQETNGPDYPFEIQTQKGPIRGQLDLVSGAKKSPLLIIVPDSGHVDRNGNIIGVDGRGETYSLLSKALVSQGIACARYDKRGVAYSYPRVRKESDLLFSDYVDDLKTIIAAFRRDPRFDSISILGHGEGSLVAAAALQGLPAKGLPVSFIALSPQSVPVQDLLREEVIPYGPEAIVEYERVLADLLADGNGEPLPEFLKTVFTPEMLGYWKTWMRYDPQELYRSISVPILLIRGSNETVSTQRDIERLTAVNQEALAIVVQGMNQVLKEGAGDQNSLFDSYLNTSEPLAGVLVSSIIDFVKK